MSGSLSALGRHWTWVLAYGILSLVAGFLALVSTSSALLALAIIFAVQLIIAGVFRFVGAFAMPAEPGWLRALVALLALASFAIGLFLLRYPALSVLVLAMTLGIYWMIHGMIELFVTIEARDLPARGWLGASGVTGILAGAVLFFAPGISAVILAVVLGAWLAVFGLLLIATALHLRSLTHRIGTKARRFSPT